MLNSQIPTIYSKSLTNELNLSYNQKSLDIKEELFENIKSQRTFSITLNAWTSIN